MKKITFLTLLALLTFSACNRQHPEDYNKLIAEARELYEAGDYEHSGMKFSEAFEVYKSSDSVKHHYKAAQAWALANKNDRAFEQLFDISGEGKYRDLLGIARDSAFYSLRTDDRFLIILERVGENKKKEEVGYSEITSLLEIIHRDDQIYRQELGEIQEKYGPDSEEIRTQWEVINKQDSINLVKVKKILGQHGWLGWDEIGRRANSAIFLVIQHADLETQEEFLPMLREAVERGDAMASDLALMEDRIALRQGKKQIYGSQIGLNRETGEYYLSPLQDPDNVNKRRAKVGLEPLEDYLSNWDLTWDAEAFKEKMRDSE